MLVSGTVRPGDSMTISSLSGNDQDYKLVVSGTALIFIVAGIAARIFKTAVIYTFAWTTIGFTVGFLAKKTLISYTLTRPIGCRLLELSRRFSILKGVVLVISAVASFVFPMLAAICATGVGVVAGFSFWNLGSQAE